MTAPIAGFAESYPNKPVKIIIPFPAGGVTDIAGRLIAQRLSERLGQQFFIENVGGSCMANLGMEKVAHSPGDGGYTVLLSSSSVTVNRESLRQDAVRCGERIDPEVTKAARFAKLMAG